MAKKDRTGRIFLDYLRNDRMSTAVALLSPRARPGAPVSMPLTWSQVRSGLDPHKYTVSTAAALVNRAQQTPGEDYAESARPVDDAIHEAHGCRARHGKAAQNVSTEPSRTSRWSRTQLSSRPQVRSRSRIADPRRPYVCGP